ncbi:MAG: SHOCT-like domain-containing protein [Anaerolineae bacterium]
MNASTEERLKILEMLQNGTITAEQASELLDALAAREEKGQEQAPRWLRIRVTDTDTGRSRVNVTLPVGLVRAGLKMGARLGPDLDHLDGETLEKVLLGGRGHVVDVLDEEDGERVEIFLD